MSENIKTFDGLKDAQLFCMQNGLTLLYLTQYGSRLFGTANEDSDTDLKALYLPPASQLLLGRMPCFQPLSTKGDDCRNGAADIDVEFYSIQRYLKLLRGGDTGAIDLLYSASNKDAVLYMDSRMFPLFANPLKLFDPLNASSYLRYAQSQAKRYSLKGAYLNVLTNVADWLGIHRSQYEGVPLSAFLEPLLAACGNGSFCTRSKVRVNNRRSQWTESLHLLGSEHMVTISFEELEQRVKRQLAAYGKRAGQAFASLDQNTRKFLTALCQHEKADDLWVEVFPQYRGKYDETLTVAELIDSISNSFADWKALSHAMRSICEIRELLLHGSIQFPLKDSAYIRAIKEGRLEFGVTMEDLDRRIEEIDDIIASHPKYPPLDQTFADNFVLSLYRNENIFKDE